MSFLLTDAFASMKGSNSVRSDSLTHKKLSVSEMETTPTTSGMLSCDVNTGGHHVEGGTPCMPKSGMPVSFDRSSSS